MYRQFYAGMELTHLPLFTLVLFTAIFFATVLRLFARRRAADFEAIAALPLEGATAQPLRNHGATTAQHARTAPEEGSR